MDEHGDSRRRICWVAILLIPDYIVITLKLYVNARQLNMLNMCTIQFLSMLMLTWRRLALSTSITTGAQKEASRRFQAWTD